MPVRGGREVRERGLVVARAVHDGHVPVVPEAVHAEHRLLEAEVLVDLEDVGLAHPEVGPVPVQRVVAVGHERAQPVVAAEPLEDHEYLALGGRNRLRRRPEQGRQGADRPGQPEGDAAGADLQRLATGHAARLAQPPASIRHRRHVPPLVDLVLRRAHDEMRHHAQRVFHVRLGASDVRGAELLLEQRHQRVAARRGDGHPQEPAQQVVYRLAGGRRPRVPNHGGHVDPGPAARGRDELARRPLPPAVGRDAGVEQLVPLERGQVERRHVGRVVEGDRAAEIIPPPQPIAHLAGAASGQEVRVAEAHDVGEQVVEGDVAPLLDEGGGDPGPALRPPRDRRRVQQVLAQRGGGAVEVGHPGNVVGPEVLEQGDDVLDRPLDVGAVAGLAVEVARAEHRREQRPQLVVVVAENRPELALEIRRRVLPHEEAVDLGRDVLGRDRLLEDDAQHVDAVEVAGPPQERLGSVVVEGGVDHEIEVLEVPAGEGAGRLADVGLGVVAHPHGEQLHHLAGEVLVRGALHVHPGVEVVEHRGVLGHRDQEVAEVAGRVPLERVDLEQHLAVVADLALGRREVPVPEQGHLLFERPVGVEHALGPPVADAAGLEEGRAQPVEEAVGDRLGVAVDVVGLDPHPHALAVPQPELGGGGPAGREVQQPLVPEPRVLERREVAVGGVVVVDQRPHRLLGAQGGERGDLLGRAPEPGPAQQVRGAVGVPVGRGDGRQVPGPRRGSGRPCGPLGRRGGAGEHERERGAGCGRRTVVSCRHQRVPTTFDPALAPGSCLYTSSSGI